MIVRFLKILLVFIAALALLYISRFWPLELWARNGAMAELGLRPQGGLLQVWLSGTNLAAFELVIWAFIVFITLSFLEKIAGPAT